MSIETAMEQVAGVRILRVRELADRVLQAIADETHPEIAVMALIEASVRILRSNGGLGAAAACKELAKVVEEMALSEAGN